MKTRLVDGTSTAESIVGDIMRSMGIEDDV